MLNKVKDALQAKSTGKLFSVASLQSFYSKRGCSMSGDKIMRYISIMTDWLIKMSMQIK